MSFEPLIGAWVPLSTCVDYYLDEVDKSDGDQDRCWILGMRGYLECLQDFSGEPLTVRLPILGNQTVPFPADCLTWSKIGLLNSNNEISTLKINPGLTTYRDTNPNRVQDLVPNVNDGIGALGTTPFYFNYYYDGGYYNLFGIAGGLIQYGECKVDEGNRIVVLPVNFQYKDIMFEYIPSPQKNDDFMVPLALQEAIIAFISWKMKTGTRQDFYAACIAGRRRLGKKKVTLQGISQWIRETGGQYLKS